MTINIDELQYKYANVRMVFDRIQFPTSTVSDVQVCAEEDQLLAKLVKKFPTFDFKMEVIVRFGNPTVGTVTIYSNGEQLGSFY